MGGAASATPTSESVIARLRSFGRSNRIVGVDVARGLAVLGMFGAHIGVTQEFDWRPETWAGLIHGRSSILFALLAGVSIAIISGRTERISGTDLARARVRIATRAVLIFCAGALVELLDTNVAVILTYYGVLFLLAIPFLRVPPGWLFALAGLTAIVMPVLVFAPRQGSGSEPITDLGGYALALLVTGTYPSLVWLAFLLAGMGIGRLELSSVRVQTWLLAAGAALAAIGYGLGEWAAATIDAGSAVEWAGTDWAGLATTEPHSGSPFEVVGSTGFAIAVLALCLMASRYIRWLLYPVAAVGAMALTAYTVQLIAIAALEVDVPGRSGNEAWLWFTLVALVACSLWILLVGRGPFEAFLTWVSRRMAQLVRGPTPAARPQPPDRSRPAPSPDRRLGHRIRTRSSTHGRARRR